MSSSELVQLMDDLAEQTWFNLREARRLGMTMGEVTITDTVLLSLARMIDSSSLSLEIVPTQSNENTTGADFEIWIHASGSRFLGMSFQAKVLKHEAGTFKYPMLSHKVAGVHQYDILLAHSLATNTIPYHLFYNGWEQPDANAPVLPAQWKRETFGCAAVPTSQVQQIRNTSRGATYAIPRMSITAQDYLTTSVPWSELFQAQGSRAGAPGSTPITGGKAASGTSSAAKAPGQAIKRPGELIDRMINRHADLSPQNSSQAGAYELPNYILSAKGKTLSNLPDDPKLPRFAAIITLK
ncbi:DUF6615 family protein [Clavibacter sp. km3a]|uniref:DUF6615 family protein n=1 Tax=Clavibacter sp. km3a TaxID=3459135 RepID=UPI004042B727